MIDAVFHVVNFLTLCYLVCYIFRAYLYERISQAMIMAQAAYTNALKRGDQLRKQEQGLIRAYYHQNYRYEELSHKTELWNQRLHELSQLQAKEREAIIEALDRRNHIQYKNTQSLLLCEQVVEQAVAEAKKELQNTLIPPQEQLYTRLLIQRVTGNHHV